MKHTITLLLFSLLATMLAAQQATYDNLRARNVLRPPAYNSLTNASAAGSQPGNLVYIHSGADSGVWVRNWSNTGWNKVSGGAEGTTANMQTELYYHPRNEYFFTDTLSNLYGARLIPIALNYVSEVSSDQFNNISRRWEDASAFLILFETGTGHEFKFSRDLKTFEDCPLLNAWLSENVSPGGGFDLEIINASEFVIQTPCTSDDCFDEYGLIIPGREFKIFRIRYDYCLSAMECHYTSNYEFVKEVFYSDAPSVFSENLTRVYMNDIAFASVTEFGELGVMLNNFTSFNIDKFWVTDVYGSNFIYSFYMLKGQDNDFSIFYAALVNGRFGFFTSNNTTALTVDSANATSYLAQNNGKTFLYTKQPNSFITKVYELTFVKDETSDSLISVTQTFVTNTYAVRFKQFQLEGGPFYIAWDGSAYSLDALTFRSASMASPFFHRTNAYVGHGQNRQTNFTGLGETFMPVIVNGSLYTMTGTNYIADPGETMYFLKLGDLGTR